MPIFEKNNKLVYFAHCPKTAGSAVYFLFLRDGWSIYNVQTSSKNKGRVGYKIFHEFGIEHIPAIGARHGYKWALQHAPASIWSQWAEFSSSFTIVRDPHKRFLSCVKYHAVANSLAPPTQDLINECIDSLVQCDQEDPDLQPALFRRQVDFTLPKTKKFRFEDDWAKGLQALYGFKSSKLEKVNVSKKSDLALTNEHIEFVNNYYKSDLDLWNSTPRI